MILTAALEGKHSAYGTKIPVQPTAQSITLPVPTGGWDAYSPLAEMPPQNAIELVNAFPYPGYIETRRGWVTHADTKTNYPVESLMSYQSTDRLKNRLFACASGGIYDVTGIGADPAVPVRDIAEDKIQYVNLTTVGGSFLWCCNGEETPFAYNGTSWIDLTFTGSVDVTKIDQVCLYRSRIWGVIKDTTKVFYLDLDSIQGPVHTIDLGSYFPKGGSVVSLATWSADVVSGTNEFILFASEFGEVAVFLIEDPTQATGISYRGTSSFGSPLGKRCFCRLGADVGFITLDGVLPISKVISYDRASEAAEAMTAKIMNAMSEAARKYGDNFGWELTDYPRGSMIILNVPVSQNAIQEQYIMNSITGSWCRFTGQNANTYCVFENRLFFGDNFGKVCEADVASWDEEGIIEVRIQTAYNYLGDARARNKRLTMMRPLITRGTLSSTVAYIAISPDFGEYGAPDAEVRFDSFQADRWNSPGSLWDHARWAGLVYNNQWVTVGEIGYCFSLLMKLEIAPQSASLDTQAFKINSVDVVFEYGAIAG